LKKLTEKDPLLWLGIISLILFLVYLSFFQYNSFKKDLEKNFKTVKSVQNLFLASGESFLIESPDLFFIQENSVRASTNPTLVTPKVFGTLVGTESDIKERKEILEYIIQEGDNLWNLAQKFDISLNTILWANNLNKNSVLVPGQKLIILPVSGTIHHVQKGETLSQIAKLYKIDIEEIISFNEIENERIFAGDILIVPNGKMPTRRYSPSQVPLASSYFICPISSPCRITQGLHWYNAIDFSNGYCGEPVFAVAGGLVQKTGYHKIAGNFIRLEHSNGVITFYGHLSRILVVPGQQVSQGQKIGTTGYSGYTIPAGPAGCHVHFEVRGARNPFAR